MADIKKVIFFIESHFNQRDYQRFGIDTLMTNGFEVEVWDFTPFLTSRAYQEISPPDSTEKGNLTVFNSMAEAAKAIKRLDSSSFIIPIISYNISSFRIFRALSKQKVPFSTGVQSCVVPGLNSAKKIRRIFTLPSMMKLPVRILKRLFLKLPYSLLGIHPARLVLAPAERYSISHFPLDSSSEILWMHSLDYDIYLDLKDRPLDQDRGKTCVFLDQNLPFHPDIAHNLDGNATVTPEEYFPRICRFFDFIEEKYGYRTVVAAHPRAHQGELDIHYGGRKVIFQETAELVRNSDLVFVHNSMAINFAVLFNKPMTFITIDKLDRSFDLGLAEGPSVKWLATYFDKEAHNLDNELDMDFSRELSINDEIYRKYINDYVKQSSSPDMPYWKIFCSCLKRLGGNDTIL